MDSPKNKSQAPSSEYHNQRDMEEFWAEIRPRREPMQKRWFLPAILVLVVLSVPWYREAGETGKIIGGLPLWIWTTIGCSFVIACLTAWMALRFWDDDEPGSREDD